PQLAVTHSERSGAEVGGERRDERPFRFPPHDRLDQRIRGAGRHRGAERDQVGERLPLHFGQIRNGCFRHSDVTYGESGSGLVGAAGGAQEKRVPKRGPADPVSRTGPATMQRQGWAAVGSEWLRGGSVAVSSGSRPTTARRPTAIAPAQDSRPPPLGASSGLAAPAAPRHLLRVVLNPW